MTKEYIAILEEIVKDYEFLAKYNGAEDYLKWNVLRACLEEQQEQEPCEECRSLKDIKELLEKKAQALDGVPISDGGGACIGIYFSIANDLPPVQPTALFWR